MSNKMLDDLNTKEGIERMKKWIEEYAIKEKN